MEKTISKTFHGRDIYAPCAAHLSLIDETIDFGPKINDPIKFKINSNNIREPIEVIHVDSFGNIITSLKGEAFKKNFKLGDNIKIQILSDEIIENIIPFKEYYSEVPEHSLLCLIGSSGFFEISANKGNASQVLNIKRKQKIKIQKD